MKRGPLIVVIISVFVLLIVMALFIFARKEDDKSTASVGQGEDRATTQDNSLNDRQINSFSDCVRAGNPILETYPPQCQTQAGQTFTETERETDERKRLERGRQALESGAIEIVGVAANQTIESPLRVKGWAKSDWFFEGTFPLLLVGEDGRRIAFTKVLADNSVSAKKSEGAVPFSGVLSFPKNVGAKGKLIFQKSNPTNVTKKETWIEIPVTFSVQQ